MGQLKAFIRLLFLSLSFLPGAAAFAQGQAIYFYGSNFSKPNLNLRLIEDTRARLEGVLGVPVIYAEKDIPGLAEIVRDNKADIIVAGAGFLRQRVTKNIRAVATMVTPEQPDPNRAVGSLVLARKDDARISLLPDLRGMQIGANFDTGFQGTLLVLYELVRLGLPQGEVEKNLVYFGHDHAMRLRALSEGRIDAAIIPSCYAEHMASLGVDLFKDFKAVGERKQSDIACRVSTDLYPNFTLMLVTDRLSVGQQKSIFSAVFSMEGQKGLGWSFTSDYGPVEEVYRTLGKGLYRPQPWTWRRVWEQYRPVFLFVLSLLASLFFFSVYSSRVIRRRTEQLHRAMDKEKELLEERSRFNTQLEKTRKAMIVAQISNLVAHELSQPLASICLYTKSIDNFSRKGGRPEQVLGIILNAVRSIDDCAKRAREIVQNVRNYSKADSHRLRPANIVPVLRKCVSDFVTLNMLPPMAIVQHFMAEDACVEINRLEIELAVNNILRNSFEACGKDPARMQVAFGVSAGAGRVNIRISDYGSRFDASGLGRLNEPFSTEKSEGLGLGLMIVRSIVSGHFGEIVFSCNENGGLQVFISLPLCGEGGEPPAGKAPAGRASAGQDGSGQRHWEDGDGRQVPELPDPGH